MTQEDKQLLLKDLCARLPYSTLCFCKWVKDAPNGTDGCVQELSTYLIDEIDVMYDTDYECPIYEVKPYLRPMSSMTEEEKKEYFGRTLNIGIAKTSCVIIDWLNAHYFDYRGLIEKGLAIEVTKENNPYK